ncbi:hypothetical protein KKC83_01515, partial [Patescibacteria group bacterium]|nr:hypothetical protein [Patescibacteria group bacterium]MBU4015088.1 hypothetical protein [Patescibacteria group bacterium]MBU4026204.1 hypothetical protein [Patescibacteria group bacterium]MBU4073708.1 hypothetical protein [Patescibacteria group bacterium]MBU4103399.1 hypothetical protein [Patescibacteria group bacterium]
HSFGIVICPVPNSFNVLVSIKLYNYIIIQLTNYIITQLKILSNMNPAITACLHYNSGSPASKFFINSSICGE